ncbi:hypothetical protein Taro_053225 [Colocasia esculenta]|uniref:Aminotransferase-like plant mobile domain-containing protein n=1 Tax=Colocasia esculenta TaxID=4460 RepID=A0A843XKN4_COLES|nr:hypothetical protein [Colocasia esculenta]
MARLTEDAGAVLAEEEGDAVDRDLRRFLILVIGKLILGTRGNPVSCRCLPLLEDLSSVGNYAWGAALLAHLFDSLGTSSRETGVAGFFPLLQVWEYHQLPSLSRGVVTLIHDCLDTIPFGHVQWTPYVGENDAAQPWVERGHPYFVRDVWLHCFNTVVPLHHQLVARTLGLHQAVLDDWEQRGKEVISEATSDEDYFRAYARKYGAQVYKGTRRPLDPEGRIVSLEGILHSTIQQRDDLQAVVDQLMVGGASSSREDPGRSVLKGQLASVELELRNALGRTTTLEAEMAELRLRPEAAEVTRWHEAAEEATRWLQEAEEATRLRVVAGDLRTQLGEERHRCELLWSEMKGLERA